MRSSVMFPHAHERTADRRIGERSIPPTGKRPCRSSRATIGPSRLVAQGEEYMRNPWNAVLAEATGTFLFFFVGIGSVAMSDWSVAAGGEPQGLVTVALAHGLVLAVLVSALAAVSGAHFNPAVTFGVWIAGQIPGRRAVSYILAQLIGGIAAAWSLRAIFPASVSPGLGTPQLGAGISPGAGIAIETVLTVILLIAVFGTAIDPRGPKVGGLIIGLAVGADI